MTITDTSTGAASVNELTHAGADISPVEHLTLATDGACSGNPGPAGWAWVDEHGNWSAGPLRQATNQAAEMLGLVEAIGSHVHVRHLTIEIDSAYAMNTYLTWMDAHVRRGWHTQAGKPTSNRTIIEMMLSVRAERRELGLPPVTLVKVKGHAGGKHPLNDAADDRATWARDQSRAGNLTQRTGSGMVIAAAR
ncbi:RNase H family protein [Oerskovia enterophila]|uniref:ribonuclease H n=1 Tax=Oerskovia enterophila TaxID=43678 RepID=A0ABX2Y854_9CELL|nr:RNase H family protein [Oerskovia enterophila]OCI32773.1 ribonuclease H [Oerskovia enterophila]